MFRTLLRRQFIEDILTYRFLVSLVLILAAIIIFALIFARHYHNLQSVYSNFISENDRNLAEFAVSPSTNLRNTEQLFILRPRPELFIAEANEDNMPQGFLYKASQYSFQLLSRKEEVAGAQAYAPISKKESLTDVLTYSPDLTFIVQFILSFFALILAYDAITEEKERGTLGLVYSNPAKRAYFVIAKYLSALFTIGIALSVGLLLSLILLSVSLGISLSSPIIFCLALFFLAAMIYLSAFILLGLSCSASSHSSKTSLVLCLLIWVFLVIVFPKSTGMLLTLKRFDVPTEEEINEMAEKSSQEAGGRLYKQLPPEYRTNLLKYQLNEKVLKLNFEIDKSRQDVLDFYLRKKLAAIEEVRRTNFFSPASLFEYAASSVSGTGLFHFENLWIKAQRYEDDFTTFVRDKNSVLEKGAFFYLGNSTISDRPLDFNAIPKFEDKLPSPGERLKEALPYLGLLALYNLFLFAFVFYKFQNYDVR
jgi:ABC-type transport system involved in multi-copper enzyme maturation permease subunit